jgi:spermidine synthase
MRNFQKIFSYIIPITLYKKTSEINESLEITWNNGKLVLDSKNANLSYGNLQKVLRFGLQKTGYQTIANFQNILVLGVAGASVIDTIVNEIKYKNKITGVEIDPEIIKIATDYFKLNTYKNLEIVIDDAQNYIAKTTQNFNLIIIDVFEDNLMPSFLFETTFIANYLSLLSKNGIVLFNTIVTNKNQLNLNNNFEKLLQSKGLEVQRFNNLYGENEIFIAKKL